MKYKVYPRICPICQRPFETHKLNRVYCQNKECVYTARKQQSIEAGKRYRKREGVNPL